jgi:sugar/nucleoside kinase (ribokinase family)
MGLERPFDLAIAGELNLDLILYGLPLLMETERDLLGTDFGCTLGSSSAIVAHNAAMLGLRVCFTTLVGDDDFGRLAVSRLVQAGVDVSSVIVDPTVTTGVTILLPHGGERHSLSYLGAIAQLSVKQLDVAKLKQARHLHLCSLYLQQGLHEGLPELLEELKNDGMTISLDTNDDPKDEWGGPLHRILPLVDIFMPNESELRRMAGKNDVEEAIRTFAPEVRTMIVKRGRRGCSIRHDEEITHLAGLSMEPVDTIGAGDSFDAGFITAFLRGLDVVTCARAGNIAGALSTQGKGGTEAFRDVVLQKAFLEKHGFPA